MSKELENYKSPGDIEELKTTNQLINERYVVEPDNQAKSDDGSEPDPYDGGEERPSNNTRLDELQSEPCFLEPINGRCVIVRDGFKYSGKIIIPEKHKQLPTTGRIVAVSDIEHSSWLGRRVLWGRYAGMPTTFDGTHSYDVMTYEEIMCFINDDVKKLTMDDLSGLNRTED